ncbi:MAG: SsrA-binding protein SmpB [Candidatus Latescibacteria bacterium]|nr:SsrA-binding protein SmpB [Candidatus Latescibacterota bacterium]
MAGENQASQEGIKIVAQNRKARHDYEVLDTFEAGIALLGSEVKAVREGRVALKDSYAVVQHGEVFLQKVHISHYGPASRFNHDLERPRKLLLHRWQINRLVGQTEQKGLTMVPLKIYFRRGRAKVELALVRGKKFYDKRQDIAKRDAARAIDRELRGRQ